MPSTQKKVEKTLYEQLGIDSKATKQQISGAYNDLLNKVCKRFEALL